MTKDRLAMIKPAILKLLDRLGYELRPKQARISLAGALRQAKNLGFDPRTVIDAGAAYGDFSLQCAAVFPEAGYLLIEPLLEYRPFIEAARKKLPKSHYAAAALASHAGKITINVHPDLAGSSIYLENEDSDVNGSPREVDAMTIDGMIAGMQIEPPFLLKIDAQGAELEILDGAQKTLPLCGFVLLETSFFRFFGNAPQFPEVIGYMKDKGFAPYDVFGLSHRPLDFALAQAEVAFVKEKSPFRKHHHYATRDQRALLTKRLKRR